MTFGPRRLSLNEVQPPAPVRLPRPAAPPRPDQRPPPDHLALGRALDTLTRRPVAAQRQAVQAPLRAAALARQEDGQLRQRRQALEVALDDPGAAPVALPAPSVQRSPGARPRTPGPQTPGEWAAALRDRAGAIEGRPLDARQAAQFTALQRQVAHTLAQGFRQDRRAPQDRYGDYGDHLATLQRHPVSAPVAGVVLGLVPAAERPALQRAAAEGLERQLAHEAAQTRAGSRLAVQRQLADLDAEAGRPLLERIQARRGAGNPLPEAVRRHLEGGLNHDLSRVRIHDDAEAHKLAKGVRALAFTTGTDIFFRRGHFDPNSRNGLELLAHEVTHTVQQSRGRVGGGVDPDAGLEAEARGMGAKLAQAMPSTVMPSAKGLLPPVSPHAPGVYTPAAATARVQAGAAQRFALKPLHDLQPRSVQRFDLGGALGAAWDATGGKVVEKGKELVASGLKVIPGYKELCLAFGRDLVTGKAVGGSAEAILTALTNWVPGPLKDMLRALRETNVIGKAWAWFKGELGKLDLTGALGEIAGAIGKADLGAATSAVTRRISGVKNLIVGSARKIAEIGLTALTAGLGPLGQQIMAKLRGAGDVIVQVLRDPVRFARNLISAVGGGFKTFGSNAPRHLQNGIGQWLTGASGITFPASFSLEGVFMTALSVMGLTYQALRGKLVRALGPGGADKVGRAESTVQALQTMKAGLQHASEMKGEQGGVGKAVQDGVKSEVTKSLVLTGIQKLVTMLVPGGGFINSIIGAFQTVQTIVQQAAQIGQVVTSALGSVAAIAAGNISGAVGLIDRALGGAIPVALAWLGKLVGLGNLGGKIRNVINKVRGRLDRVVDKIVAKVKGIIEKALGKGKAGGKPGAPPATVAERNKSLTEKEKGEKLRKAVSSIQPLASRALQKGLPKSRFETLLLSWQKKFDLTSLTRQPNGQLVATVNPSEQVPGIDADPVSPEQIGRLLLPLIAEAEAEVHRWIKAKAERQKKLQIAQQKFAEKKPGALQGLTRVEQQLLLSEARFGKGRYNHVKPEVHLFSPSEDSRGMVQNIAKYADTTSKSGRFKPGILNSISVNLKKCGASEDDLQRLSAQASSASARLTIERTIRGMRRTDFLHNVFEPAREPGIHTVNLMSSALISNQSAHPTDVLTAEGSMAPMTPVGAAPEKSTSPTPEHLHAQATRYERVGNIVLGIIRQMRIDLASQAKSSNLLINSGRTDLSSMAKSAEGVIGIHFQNSKAKDAAAIQDAVLKFKSEVFKIVSSIG